MVKSLSGKLYGDKGDLSKALAEELLENDVELVSNVRKIMKKKVISLWDLKKRLLIETINDQLKNISYVEHTRHLSPNGFMLNMLAGLIAYCLKENQPSIAEAVNIVAMIYFNYAALIWLSLTSSAGLFI